MSLDKLLATQKIADVIKQWQTALIDRALETQAEATCSLSTKGCQTQVAHEGDSQVLVATMR